MRNSYILVRKVKGKSPLGRPRDRREVILKLILGKLGWRMWTVVPSGQGPVAGSRGKGNKLCGSAKGDHLYTSWAHYQRFNNDLLQWVCHFVRQRRHVSITRISLLTLFRNIIAIYSENYKIIINTLCRQNAVYLNVTIRGPCSLPLCSKKLKAKPDIAEATYTVGWPKGFVDFPRMSVSDTEKLQTTVGSQVAKRRKLQLSTLCLIQCMVASFPA